MDLSAYDAFFARLAEAGFADFVPDLRGLTAARLSPSAHGDLPRWRGALGALPAIAATWVDLDAPCVTAASDPPADEDTRQALRSALMALHPWRKGPLCLHGVRVDSEWRSDRKWDRLAGEIAPLADRTVLDVGCGNGYYAWRMAGRGARLVLGVDPTLLYVVQFLAVARYLGDPRVAVLPLALEDLPAGLARFDTVFSMGVLSHRRSPIDHLLALRRLLRPGGELVLETLVVDGEGGGVLAPPGRYARMRNVWFIPRHRVLAGWLARTGFAHVRLVDVTATSLEEQRTTEWMRFESLRECLDPEDPTRTVEGHPAPRRGILVAQAA